MPSVDEMNAAFDAIEVDLHLLIENMVPFMFKSQARTALDSQDGRQSVLNGIKKALVAAEKVRAAKPQ